MGIKYSIIIAAYNVEKYIDDCLESLVNLDYKNSEYEIIVVDDGSTDTTYGRACKWKKEFDNLIVVTQPNNCQGAARNRGISLSRGKWVMFCDADDWYSGINILKILDSLITEDVDFIKSTSWRTTSKRDGFIKELNQSIKPFVRKGSDLLLDYSFRSHIWPGCYNKTFIDKLNYRFCEGVKYEDTDWSMYVHIFAKKIITVDLPFYTYFNNPYSTTSAITVRCYEDIFLSLLRVLDIAKRGDKVTIDVQNNLRKRVKDNIKDIVKLSRNQEASQVIKIIKKYKKSGLYDNKNYECSFYEQLFLVIMTYIPEFLIYPISWATNIKRCLGIHII